MLITFSGLDGAGKTTLINWLRCVLEEKKHAVVVLTMYDHLSLYALVRKVRDLTTSAIRRLGPGWRRAKELPVSDGLESKGVINKFLYGVARSNSGRQIALFFDLLILILCRFYYEGMRKNILITDRYLYDTLVDVADSGDKRWWFIRSYLHLVPPPDIPILVDTSPEDAFSRKGEYSLEYLRRRRVAYHRVFSRVSNPLIIVNQDLRASQKMLEAAVTKKID